MTAELPYGICLCIRDGEALDCSISEGKDAVTFNHLGQEVASIPRDLMGILCDVLPGAALSATAAGLDDVDRAILEFCSRPSKLDSLEKASRATQHRRAGKLEAAGLIEKVSPGTFVTTPLGLRVLKGGASSGREEATGAEGDDAMPNPYSLDAAVRELRALKEVCEEYHVSPRDLRRILVTCIELGKKGLEEEDLHAMLEVAEETGASPTLIISAFKSVAQMEQAKKALERPRAESKVLRAEIKSARRALKHVHLDPYELDELSALKQQMDEACAWPVNLGDFFFAREKLAEHLGDDPGTLTTWVCHLAQCIAKTSEKAGIPPDEAVEQLRLFVQEGVAFGKAIEDGEKEVEQLRAERQEIQASIGELRSQRGQLVREIESLKAEQEALAGAEQDEREGGSAGDPGEAPGEVQPAGPSVQPPP